MTVKQIAERYDLWPSRVSAKLREGGVHLRPSNPPPRAGLREDFFKRIDTPEKAYWLGFILTDGHLSGRLGSYEIVIALKTSDAGHLRKFATALGVPDIRLTPQRPSRSMLARRYGDGGEGTMRLCVSSKALHQDVAALGILPGRKTGRCRIPKVPARLVRHFWRGVVDGDGSISSSAAKNFALTLCGDAEVVCGLADYAQRVVYFSGKARPQRTIWAMAVQNRIGFRFASHLYRAGDVALARKANNLAHWAHVYS